MYFNKSNRELKNVKCLFSTEKASETFSPPFLKGTKAREPKSQYGMMLRESKKLSLLYGDLSKKYLQKIFAKSSVVPSKKKQSIFSILESRLDVVLHRAAFFESIATAKQFVILGGIKVNKKKVISPGYIVKPGDVVEVFEKKGAVQYHKNNLQEKPLFGEKSIERLLDTRLEKKIKSRFQKALLLFFSIKLKETSRLIEQVSKAFYRLKLRTKSISYGSAVGNRFNKNKAFSNIELNNNSIAFGESSLESILHLPSEQESNSHLKSNNLSKQDCTTLSQFTKENRLNDFIFLETKKFGNFLKTSKSKIEGVGMAVQGKTYLEKPFLKSYSSKDEKIAKKKNNFIEKKNGLHAFSKSNFVSRLVKKVPIFSKSSYKEKHTSKNDLVLRNRVENLTLTQNLVFSNYRLKLRKQLFSTSLKSDRFNEQKKQLFFKEQTFFESKKTKPLHLEISFRALSLIYLFPPQRVCFPSFINLSLIYK